jgi:YD repeat-containing protein
MTHPTFTLRHGAGTVLLMLLPALSLAQQNTTYQYEYDAVGNLTRITDPLLRVTDQQYDALNRLKLQYQPAINGVRPRIEYSYDGLDQLTGVLDPRNLSTTYTIDGLGNQTTQSSPDTGPTQKTYDDAGNVKTATDAKQQTTTYHYDALNRVTLVVHADGYRIYYRYDLGPNALGRLSRIDDNAGSIQYEYDQRGRIINETRILNAAEGSSAPAVTATTAYGYDTVGRLTNITYPSGRLVSYQHDGLGRIAQIDTVKDGMTRTLVSQITYHPFGGVQSFVNGANRTVTRGMDLDGRTSSYTLANQTYAIGYDAASRIRTITNLANPANIQNFAYDELDRLTQYNGSGSDQTLTYDLTGNRTGKIVGSSSTSYGISPGSNRLLQLSGAQNASYVIDPNGSITHNGNNQFGYDVRGRMVTAQTALGPVQYKINALGQRIAKTVAGSTTVFHYDLGGKLIAESGEDAVSRDYIYLHDLPVALLQ